MALVTGSPVVLRPANNLTPNSLIVGPLSGDATASEIWLRDASKNILCGCDKLGNFVVNGTLSTSTGIKTVLSVGALFMGSAAANTYYQTVATYYTSIGLTASVGGIPFLYKTPFAGSIIGVSMNANGTSAAQFLRIYKNGAAVTTFTMGSGVGGFAATAAKSSIPFAANDTLAVYLAQGTAGALYSHADLVLEMQA